jgi:hypothetical protein
MSPDFPETDAARELLVRELVAEKCRSVEGVGHVFSKRFYITGKPQYVEMLGVQGEEDGNIEVRCLFVEFLGYEDTLKGCDDAPVYRLVYGMRAVQEFIDERADGSNSSNEFAAFVMNLRNAFLRERNLGWPDRLYHVPLVMLDRVRIDDDELTGAFGHIAPFQLKVEVVP